MVIIRKEVVDDWYDGLNDAIEHNLPFFLMATYLDAITTFDYD